MGTDLQTTPTDTVAANIRAEIGRQRISQRKLAGALGMSPAAMSDRLTGKTPIDVNELHAIAGALALDVSELLKDAS
jgi:transcriptional regulator with XRE-family HTH domain